MIRLGILGSTRGTSLQPIIDAIREQRLPASIESVISNKPDAFILQRAKEEGITAQFIDPKEKTREDYDKKISALFRACQVDLIVLIGYMRILSKDFVEEWRNKMINVHPSLLPAFAGGMDKNVHQAVLDSGVKETGCTVHYVTEAVDAGPVLVQKKCAVKADDTVDSLKKRVQQLEGEALIQAIESLQK